MSSFVIDDATMHRAVATILRYRAGRHFTTEFLGVNCSSPDAGTQIGRKLFVMNREGYNQRYEHAGQTDLSAYVYTAPLPPTWIQGFKSLSCLRYQCSEGDVPETPEFAELDALCGDIAEIIVRDLPAYERAVW